MGLKEKVAEKLRDWNNNGMGHRYTEHQILDLNGVLSDITALYKKCGLPAEEFIKRFDEAVSPEDWAKISFFSACCGHDWYYQYSDDHSVWSRGNASSSALYSTARNNPELSAILKDFGSYYASSEEDKVPRPQIGNYVKLPESL